jgi:hypothetical protein
LGAGAFREIVKVALDPSGTLEGPETTVTMGVELGVAVAVGVGLGVGVGVATGVAVGVGVGDALEVL